MSQEWPESLVGGVFGRLPNTPPTGDSGHSWDIHSAAINNESLLTSSVVAYVK